MPVSHLSSMQGKTIAMHGMGLFSVREVVAALVQSNVEKLFGSDVDGDSKAKSPRHPE